MQPCLLLKKRKKREGACLRYPRPIRLDSACFRSCVYGVPTSAVRTIGDNRSTTLVMSNSDLNILLTFAHGWITGSKCRRA